MLRIDIAGNASGVGKTTLITRLLPRLPGWGTVKVSIDRGDGHAHAGRGVEVLTERTDRPGSDTARHRAAGSVRTVWVRTTPATLGRDLEAALELSHDLPGVVVESTSAWRERPGDRLILVVAPDAARPKPSAAGLAAVADLVVTCRRPSAAAREAPPGIVVDLADPHDAGTAHVLAVVATWIRP